MTTKQIKVAMLKRDVGVKELAHRLGTSSQNLSGKFKRDNFSRQELEDIAEAMGCTHEGVFRDKNTGEVV